MSEASKSDKHAKRRKRASDAVIGDSNKRTKRTVKEQVHLTECNDEECQGCAEGELDVRFAVVTEDGEQEVQISGLEMLKLAMTEKANYMAMDGAARDIRDVGGAGDEKNDEKDEEEMRVIRLFEMAVDKLRDGDKRILAAALRELGDFVGFLDHVEESVSVFQALDQDQTEVKLGLGKSLLVKAKVLLQNMDQFDAEVEPLDKVKKTVDQAVADYGKGLEQMQKTLSKHQDGELVRHAVTGATLLRDVATLSARLEDSLLAGSVCAHGLRLIDKYASEEDLEGDLDALKAELMLCAGKSSDAIPTLKRSITQARIANLPTSVHIERMLMLVDAFLMQGDAVAEVQQVGTAISLLHECIKLDPSTYKP